MSRSISNVAQTFGLKSAAIAAVLLASACGGSALRTRVQSLDPVLADAEARGAMNCAPRQLAVARAHREFAVTELDQGNTERAAQHVTIAEENARAAVAVSEPGRCTAENVVIHSVPGDADGDGILDATDRCVTIPEDLDGVDDTDGCPEREDTDGDGIPDDADVCDSLGEDLDEVLDSDGCPEPDNDLDGVLDAQDRCPVDPEDLDTFEDVDGCPENDNDRDLVLDDADACPNEPAPPAQADGCPRQYEGVEVTAMAIRISNTIFFETNKSVIRAVSFPLLNVVAQVLQENATITVEVQGHTDSRGNDARNLRLSQGRADAVRAYLLAQGVAPERLTSRGYGETRPIQSNTSAAGRAANRRVEFVRTDSGGTP